MMPSPTASESPKNPACRLLSPPLDLAASEKRWRPIEGKLLVSSMEVGLMAASESEEVLEETPTKSLGAGKIEKALDLLQQLLLEEGRE